MNKPLSRRQFLQASSLALGGLIYDPVFPRWEEIDLGRLGRVTIGDIDLRSAPRDDAPIIGKRFRDQLVHIYSDVHPADASIYHNRLWYRVWGGYLHSAHIQIVRLTLNQAIANVPESGLLGEISVPYTVAYVLNGERGWKLWRGNRLYYETTHWATGLVEGPDRKPWYQLTSELSKSEKYYIPAAHLRIIPEAEFAPLSRSVPAEQKRLEVSIDEQVLRAYESDRLVFSTSVSTGIPNPNLPDDVLPTATPKGRFHIYAKLPNKHMGSVTGNPDSDSGDSFSLPGVPWTCFFEFNGGYALHGTYWHNNFGLQMSHGCVNLRNADAKWVFRWTTPIFDTKVESPSDWARTGRGTRLDIY